MEFLYGDCHTTHPAGTFCTRTVSEYYFISYFETPYQYEFNGVLQTGNPGDVLLQPPHTEIYHGWEDGGFVNTWAYISSEELEKLLQAYPLAMNIPFPVGPENVLERFVQRATAENSVRATGWQDLLKSLLAQLVVDLYRRYQRIEAGIDQLERLREDMLCAPQKDWQLEQMANRCGYSVSRFCAVYKERFGSSPKQDVLQARLLQAQKMLCYTNQSVSEIAEACGFVYTPYFSKYFKRATGLSPKDYRKQSPH